MSGDHSITLPELLALQLYLGAAVFTIGLGCTFLLCKRAGLRSASAASVSVGYFLLAIPSAIVLWQPLANIGLHDPQVAGFLNIPAAAATLALLGATATILRRRMNHKSRAHPQANGTEAPQSSQASAPPAQKEAAGAAPLRDQQYRRHVAELAIEVWAGRLPFFEFLERVGSDPDPYTTGDQVVDDLIDFLEHQPANPSERDRQELQRLVNTLWE